MNRKRNKSKVKLLICNELEYKYEERIKIWRFIIFLIDLPDTFIPLRTLLNSFLNSLLKCYLVRRWSRKNFIFFHLLWVSEWVRGKVQGEKQLKILFWLFLICFFVNSRQRFRDLAIGGWRLIGNLRFHLSHIK